MSRRWQQGVALAAGLVITALLTGVAAAQPVTFTLNADFDQGTYSNVTHDIVDQLQLDETAEPFGFIWIAVSSQGTVVKVDTDTGEILARYRTAPAGRGLNPSRTTVDLDGSVWVGNRDETGWVGANAIAPGIPPANGPMGSAVHIGLEENGQCVDRNGNGVIDTSRGTNDLKNWTNAGGADTLGGVTTAEDECIIHYTRVNSYGTRHISVNKDNDVWIGGTGGRHFDLVDGDTGLIIRQESSVGFGGYGGLIDANGVIWSARPLLRWDTALPLTPGNFRGYGHDSYGLCIDSQGNVWNTQLGGGRILKFDSLGNYVDTFYHGQNYAQGCAVDKNDHVWVAHSLYRSSVGHLDQNGNLLGVVPVGRGPTGVSVDGNGKIWVTNFYGRTASRIDPSLGTHGAVDFTTADLGGTVYNYSDMTGSTLSAPANAGSWSVVYDSGEPDAEWGVVSWTETIEGDGSIAVSVATSADGVNFGPTAGVANGDIPSVPLGQFMKVNVVFQRSAGGDSPILYDLTVTPLINAPPVCDLAEADPFEIWPPNHKMVDVNVIGVTDPDDDEVFVTINSIFSDEPANSNGDGDFEPDGEGLGTPVARVRAERAGSKKVPGDGRFYHIGFTADDGNGGICEGTVTAVVPHSKGKANSSVDGGPLYDATVSPAGKGYAFAGMTAYPNPFNPITTIVVSVGTATQVTLDVYDLTGRRIVSLIDGVLPAGEHEAQFEATHLPSGIYLTRLTTPTQVITQRIILLK